jgi:hypothetical protein
MTGAYRRPSGTRSDARTCDRKACDRKEGANATKTKNMGRAERLAVTFTSKRIKAKCRTSGR